MEPAPHEEREHHDHDRRYGKPQRHLRRLRGATFEGEFEHCSNRHEHDQRIQTVPAHEQPDTPHAVNVLHALARRLLPEKDSKIVGWEEDKSGLRTTRRRDHHS